MESVLQSQLPFSHIDEHLSIPCAKCENYIPIRNLQKHRELHRAMKLFRCTVDTKAKSLKQLLKKRRQIINDAIGKADSANPIPAKIMQKIDWAFEFLKKDLTTEGYQEMQVKSSGPTARESFHISGYSEKLQASGLAFGVCQCQNDTWRVENEDRYAYKEESMDDLNCGFFGVFDGYNGPTAAEKCKKNFYDFLIEEIALFEESETYETAEGQERREEFIKQAMKNSFRKMDNFLLHGESETSKHRWSGASATICYIEKETLYVGNVGNVRALLVKGDGDAVSVVGDHVLRNKRERERIKDSNGSVSVGSKSALVNGLVSSTRGLGNHGDPNLKSSVICKPKISVTAVKPEDQFLILFSAGVWEVFSDEEVMFLLEDIMPDTSEVENLRQHFHNLAAAPTYPGHLATVLEESTPVVGAADIDNQNLSLSENPNTESAESLRKGQRFNETGTSIDETKNDEVWLKRDRTIYKESKACFLARALVERLTHAALLAGSRENITAAAVLLHGCPINLYLLPNVRRKSVVQKLKISDKGDCGREKIIEQQELGKALKDSFSANGN